MTSPVGLDHSMQSTILVTNRWNRSHFVLNFLIFLHSLFTSLFSLECPSPFPMLSHTYFGVLRWLQSQINTVERKITQVFQDFNCDNYKYCSLYQNSWKTSSLLSGWHPTSRASFCLLLDLGGEKKALPELSQTYKGATAETSGLVNNVSFPLKLLFWVWWASDYW